MLITNTTWQDLHESYGHVQIDDMHQADKDRIFKEAVNNLSDEYLALVMEMAKDRGFSPLARIPSRANHQKMASDLWAHVHAAAQDEADEWEGLDCE